jgi:hypothetical protein
MKSFKALVMILVLAAAAFPQTEKLGMNSFANTNGPILMAVDASLASRQLDQPYLMLVLYMAAKQNGQDIRVSRGDVKMVFNGQEYALPSVKEFRKEYAAEVRDLDFYAHLGKEGIAASWIRIYTFPAKTDFFPPNTQTASLAADAGSMYNFVGFNTLLYFKNPGFKKGDTILIKARDIKDAALTGEVEITL